MTERNRLLAIDGDTFRRIGHELFDAIPDIIATLGRTVDAELRAQLKAGA